MPKSVLNQIVEKLSGSSDNAPTRYDLYDLQRSIEGMTHTYDVNVNTLKNEIGDLCGEIGRLQEQIDALTRIMNDLTSVIGKLVDRV